MTNERPSEDGVKARLRGASLLGTESGIYYEREPDNEQMPKKAGTQMAYAGRRFADPRPSISSPVSTCFSATCVSRASDCRLVSLAAEPFYRRL